MDSKNVFARFSQKCAGWAAAVFAVALFAVACGPSNYPGGDAGDGAPPISLPPPPKAPEEVDPDVAVCKTLYWEGCAFVKEAPVESCKDLVAKIRRGEIPRKGETQTELKCGKNGPVYAIVGKDGKIRRK